MPWYDRAVPEELPWPCATRTKKDKFILHTSVWGKAAALREWRKREVLWSTFYVELDGKIKQFCDSSWHAQANGEASASAISVETEDRGRPEKTWAPWSKAQVASLIELIRWCAQHHPIPLVRCPTETGAGVGFHAMFGVSSWNKKAHECPAAARIAQFTMIIMPELMKAGSSKGIDVELGGYRGLPVWSEVARMRAAKGDGVWLEDILRAKLGSPNARVPGSTGERRTTPASNGTAQRKKTKPQTVRPR
jgi:hypothetical protein